MSNSRSNFEIWLWPYIKLIFETQKELAEAKDIHCDPSYISKMLNCVSPMALILVLPVLIREGAFSSEEEVFAGLELIPDEAFGKLNRQKKKDKIKDAVFSAFADRRKSKR